LVVAAAIDADWLWEKNNIYSLKITTKVVLKNRAIESMRTNKTFISSCALF